MRVVILIIFVHSLWASDLSLDRGIRTKLANQDIEDVFYRNPQRSSVTYSQQLSKKSKDNYNIGFKSTKIRPTGQVTKCRGQNCLSTTSSHSSSSNFLNKALNVLDKFPNGEKDTLFYNKPESFLAKALATTSGIEETKLSRNNTGRLANGLFNSDSQHNDFYKRHNWYSSPHGHSHGPHNRRKQHYTDPFYSTGRAHTRHGSHRAPYHDAYEDPFLSHRRHHPIDHTLFNYGPVPPYPDLPKILSANAVNYPVHHYPGRPIIPGFEHHTNFPGFENSFNGAPPFIPGMFHPQTSPTIPAHHYTPSPIIPGNSYQVHHMTSHQPLHHYSPLPSFLHHQSMSVPIHHYQVPTRIFHLPIHQANGPHITYSGPPHIMPSISFTGPSQVVPFAGPSPVLPMAGPPPIVPLGSPGPLPIVPLENTGPPPIVSLGNPGNPAMGSLGNPPGPFAASPKVEVHMHKMPVPVPFPVPSPPMIKEVPVPIKVPVREPPQVHKFFYPVGVPQPSQVHHVPYPVYIPQPPKVEPYFVRVSSPPQQIPYPVASPPNVIVQRVAYPVLVPKPVRVVHKVQKLITVNGHCVVNPCVNGGTCSAFKDYYRCHCQEGYKGVHCEEQSKCHPNPCRNLGICTELEKEYECTCQPGYKGINCESSDPCTPSPCKNGGVCAQVGSSYDCQCKIGWIGKDCGMESKCLPINPCRNAGVCTEALGTYHCNCMQGWQGINCEMLRQSLPPTIRLPSSHVVNIPHVVNVPHVVHLPGGCTRCHPHAYCNQNRCVCEAGYVGDGLFCDSPVARKSVTKNYPYFPFKRQRVGESKERQPFFRTMKKLYN